MYLYFENFRYDTEKQLLYKAEELIPLKRNQAAMLDFFLSDTESIHSKEVILNAVWGNQVVSEQVVFQTISQLRAILGADTIKTFTKKGYKWELKVLTQPVITQTDNLTNEQALPSKTTRKRLPKPQVFFIMVAAFFALIMTVYIVQPFKLSNEQVEVNLLISKYVENQSQGNEILTKALSQSAQFTVKSKVSQLSISQIFSTPQLAVKQLNAPPEQWHIWGKLYLSKQYAIFHYGLSNQTLQWQGYIQTQSLTELPNAISERLQQLYSMGLFTPHSSKLDWGKISSMRQEMPNDKDLMLLAAKYHQYAGQDDVALSYLQKLIRSDSMYEASPYKAEAHWLVGKIYKMRGQHLQSHNSLSAMSKALKHVAVAPLHFEYVKTKAWLAFDEMDYEVMYQTLNNGLNHFESGDNKQPLMQFKLHILASILAQKASNHDKKYYHLNQAQALLLRHKLDDSNLSAVYYHLALFSQYEEQEGFLKQSQTITPNNYVVYLERILELQRTADNFWIHDAAMELLVKQYIENDNFTAANALFSKSTMSAKKLFLKSGVLLAQDKNQDAIELYERAFEQARIDYDTRTAIESALALYRLSNNNPKAQAEYLAYLETNANERWLQENHVSINNQ